MSVSGIGGPSVDPTPSAPAEAAPAAAPAAPATPAAPRLPVDEKTAGALALAAFGPPDPSLAVQTSFFGPGLIDVVVHRRSPVRPFPIVERDLAMYRVNRTDGSVRKLDPAKDLGVPPDSMIAKVGDVLGATATEDTPDVKTTVQIQDPYLGAHPITVRLPGEDFTRDDAGIPLAGPTGPHAHIVSDNPISDPLAPATPDPATGHFVLKPGDPRLTDLTAFAAANRVFHLGERYAGLEPRWAPGGSLPVLPRFAPADPAMLNAYFDPTACQLNFYYGQKWTSAADDPSKWTEKVVYDTAQSTGVVAHETGHALFNSFKPWTLASLMDPAGQNRHRTLHEGMADIASILDAFRQPTLVHGALKDGGGDLRKPNRIANLAAGAAAAIAGLPPGPEPVATEPVIRTALNTDVYDPATSGGIECHKGSQPLTAGVYELIARLTDEERARGGRAAQAALHASDTVGGLVYQGLAHLTDDGVESLPAMAEAILACDLERNGGKHADDIIAAFKPRSLLDDQSIARVKARLAGVPALEKPAGLADEGLDAADSFLAANRAALGFPADPPLHATRVETDKWGYTRVCYRQEIDDDPAWKSWADQNLPDGAIGKLDRAAIHSVGSAYVLFRPDGSLADAAASLSDSAAIGGSSARRRRRSGP